MTSEKSTAKWPFFSKMLLVTVFAGGFIIGGRGQIHIDAVVRVSKTKPVAVE